MTSVSSIIGAGSTFRMLHFCENSFVRKRQKYFKEIECEVVRRIKLA
jgi:hypothetical protein